MKVGPGDTILAWMSNEAEHVATIFAAARQGINVVNAKDFAGESELSTIIKKSNCKCIIYSGTDEGDHGLLKDTIPQLVHEEAWDFGPKLLKSPDFPALRYVMTTRWDRPYEGMVNFKEILMYDAVTRYQPAVVSAQTELGRAVPAPGQLSRPYTHGQVLAAAEKLTGELQLTADSKLSLEDQSLFGIAVGATLALHNTIPLIIPSEHPDEAAKAQAVHDEGELVVLDGNLLDSQLL